MAVVEQSHVAGFDFTLSVCQRCGRREVRSKCVRAVGFWVGTRARLVGEEHARLEAL